MPIELITSIIKPQNCIESLHINDLNIGTRTDLSKLCQSAIISSVPSLNVPHCKALALSGSEINPTYLNVFHNLKCLEIYVENLNITYVNQIMHKCAHSLISVSFKARDIDNAPTVNTLKITANIEWLKLRIDHFESVLVDLSDCDKLIGIVDNGLSMDRLYTWPKNEYIIPFGSTDVNRTLNLILLQKAYPILFYGVYIIDKSIFGRIKFIADVKQKLINNKNSFVSGGMRSFMLPRREMNNDLFYKLMDFKFENKSIRDYKILQYQQLWQLNASTWLHNLLPQCMNIWDGENDSDIDSSDFSDSSDEMSDTNSPKSPNYRL